MARLDGNALPIIPLPRNKLFLPGANQRIDVRSIGPLLSSIYERSPVDRPGAPSGAQVVCVPISSSKSSHPPWNGEHHDVSEKEADMSSIKAADLFTYGVSARVVGIEEMEQGQGAVMKVQGIARCRVKSVSEDGPFLVATDYEYCPDQGIYILASSAHHTWTSLLTLLQYLSRTGSFGSSSARSRQNQYSSRQFSAFLPCSRVPRGGAGSRRCWLGSSSLSS